MDSLLFLRCALIFPAQPEDGKRGYSERIFYASRTGIKVAILRSSHASLSIFGKVSRG